MNNARIDSRDITLSTLEVFWLEPEDFDQAKKISKKVNKEANHWQNYLNGLALFGFERWLEERVDKLPINKDKCSVFQPDYANLIETVCNLRVGDFNLCILVTENLLEPGVNVPIAAVELPEIAAHFYIIIEVKETQEHGIIRGVLRHDELVKYRESANLPQGNRNYNLPLSLFDEQPNHLLHYLRWLDSQEITIPVADTKRSVQEILPFFADTAINTAEWLRGEMDQLASCLSWQLLPDYTFSKPLMRRISPVSDEPDRYRAIAKELRRQKGLIVPAHARGSYQTVNLNGILFKLCAVTWFIYQKAPEDTREWALLLLIEDCLGNTLPPGMKLRISEFTGVVSEAVLVNERYLHVAVAGSWNQKFVVTISLSNGASLTLLPFAFEPDKCL
ncbi:MAG: DUF1822 family protein [Moorea sp. SIO1F2]|uniref:DUF1822 family protein n=1 Tax=Moorena sp. SIO1F2 TaxID=2607819 RepID=UPI0013BA579D|nr:DUF1822 family protein [Moorena sp. SIO1F2]NET84825.1 DUF1822 family protein [Moorena sp. SIO1F2]